MTKRKSLSERKKLVNAYQLAISFVPSHRGRGGRRGRGMKPRFSRDRTFTMIHGIKAVIISKVQGRTKVEVVKCYDLRDYRMIPRIPANMRRDVERFWACLREGISDDEFIDEQYVKHGD